MARLNRDLVKQREDFVRNLFQNTDKVKEVNAKLAEAFEGKEMSPARLYKLRAEVRPDCIVKSRKTQDNSGPIETENNASAEDITVVNQLNELSDTVLAQ